MIRRFALCLLCTAALAFTGCGDDDISPTGGDVADTSGGDADMTDAGDGGGADDSGNTDAGGSDGLVDPTFRLTVVDIQRPIGGIGNVLENLITADIDDDLLHVLIQFRDFDSSLGEQEFMLTGTAGDKAEGGYTWYPGAEPTDDDFKPATFSASGEFANTENLAIIFPALEPGAEEPLQIPVSELALTGTLIEDGDSWYIAGLLSGAILASEIEGIDVNISGQPDGPRQPLSQLLGDFDYPLDAADEDRIGWALEADIEAEPITYVEPEM